MSAIERCRTAALGLLHRARDALKQLDYAAKAAGAALKERAQRAEHLSGEQEYQLEASHPTTSIGRSRSFLAGVTLFGFSCTFGFRTAPQATRRAVRIFVVT
jgi:hypothetical protein